MPYRVRRHSVALLLALLLSSVWAQQDYAGRFEQAWGLVAERYWDLEASGVDWQAVGDEYRGRAVTAQSDEEFYKVLEKMYEELGDDHSVFVPPDKADEIRESYGNLPCLPVLSLANDSLLVLESTPRFFVTSPSPGLLTEVGILRAQGEGSFGRVSFEMVDGLGYLKVPDLATIGIAADVRDAVEELVAANANGLILDLRGNPGGRLVEMMQVAGIFTGGFLWRVLTTWSLPIPYPALGGTATDLPLAILVDGGVNSAAEGLAGALKESGRATIVGETTAGNVEAVLPFCLRDGSQAWIASGVLAPIGAPTWEGRGVTPDVTTPPDEALEAAIQHLNQR